MPDTPTDARPNVRLLRQAHAAIRAGDAATLSALLADDVTWHVAGQSRVSGDYAGRAAVLELLEKMRALSDGTFALEDEDLLESPERAVSLCHVSARRDGKMLDADYCEVIRVRAGRIVEGWSFAFDQYAFDFFWL